VGAGVVQQLQPAAGLVGLAGQGPQLRGVPQRRDAAGRAAVLVRGALVDGEQPVADRIHLVGHGPARGQQLGGGGVEPEIGDGDALHLGGQGEQPAGLVIGEQQPAVPADDDHPFPYGVQNRVVVLVHPGHLGRVEAVGLAAQPSAHQRHRGRGHQQHGGGGSEQQRELVLDDTADPVDGDPGGHQPDHVAVGIGDGDHGLHQRPDGADDLLRDDLAPLGRTDLADELLADPVGQRVGVADALGVRHDDEVDMGTLAGGLGPWLQHLGRIGAAQGLLDARRVGEGLGDGDGPVAGLALAVGP
jgi:hypothetical protein